MYQMVLLVLDDLERSGEVLAAWEDAGVSGVTILESSGLGRMRNIFGRDDLPLIPSISSLLKSREEQHRTFFTLVDSDEMVDKLIEVTQAVAGQLSEANKGILFVLPVTRAIGISSLRFSEQEYDD